MAPSTIRNLVWKNELIENVHYAQDHGRHLLNGPSIFSSNTRGFTKFVQLILIAIFIG